MTGADVIAALELPAGASVDQRVPKKLLLENGAPTAGDKRSINDGIEALLWIAALKPTTIGVAAYRDDVREYLEIAVLQLALRPDAKALRLTELVHRAIPYPVLLIGEQGAGITISAAHKRWSQNETDKTVLADEVVSADINPADMSGCWPDFRASLSLARQPSGDLHALYQGWIDVMLAWQAARRTGRFSVPNSPASALARREALAACARLEAELRRLRAAAAKEKQMNRRVDINLAIQRLEAEMVNHQTELCGEAT
ncbi:DUF4391 domain-containing protein [Acidiphilium multivorum]|uniref:DUF4391 domain-containing protein n=1 Tax=Acidiphilium multivorum TaxID=62140 RepID=UPI001B8AE18C|nr:DUF4391 domain-containing protein [Acidiphilium multivorum]MBS3024474.1 DUF4391 domain-containing protein [Acidiphilium multivorum]